jgi:integral membrane protein
MFRFRWVAILEGVSYLLLLCIAMPLKYAFNMPQMVQIVGMLHGLLFVAYIFVTIQVHFVFRLSFKKTIILLLASLLPILPFYMESKILKK